jgi:glycerol-3-phosphate acyltransferase PlsY
MINDISIWQVLLVVVASYLIGSFPTAYVIGLLKQVNVFEVGSGNMGGTNIARAMGARWGVLVYLIDCLKGVIALWIAATWLMPNNFALATVVAGMATVAGHNWSLFVVLITGTLRGGKGAATAFGTMVMIAPFQVIAGMLVVGGLLIVLTRYVSLGVLAMVAIATPWMLILISQHALENVYIIYTVFISGILLWRFRSNIHRLLTGTERRLGERI